MLVFIIGFLFSASVWGAILLFCPHITVQDRHVDLASGLVPVSLSRAV
jgi:hypothetical protein